MHSVILSSTLCREEYPNNNGCDFTNQLNQPLDLSRGKWGVCVSEIVYEPNFWYNIRQPFNVFSVTIAKHHAAIERTYVLNFKVFEFKLDKIPENVNDEVTMRVGFKFFTDLPNYQYTIYDTVKKANSYGKDGKPIKWPIDNTPEHTGWFRYQRRYGNLIITQEKYKFWRARSFITDPASVLDREEYEDPEYVYFSVDEIHPYPKTITADITLECKSYPETGDFIVVFNDAINNKIYEMLIESRADKPYLDEKGKYITTRLLNGKTLIKINTSLLHAGFNIILEMDVELQYILGYSSHNFEDYELHLGVKDETTCNECLSKYNADINRYNPTSLWLFSDIVKQSYIKDITKPLLRCVALDKTSFQISYESSAYLQYVPVTQAFISSIRIWTCENYLADPLYTKAEMYLRLDFLQIE